jgi:hypothetical protein
VTVADDAFVFNIVWTGTAFTYLQYFVASQIDHSAARFRFVLNGCPPEQAELMEEFAARQPERVVEVFTACDEMQAHGIALDAALRDRDDGEFFCFIDPDIMALGPFVADFAARLEDGCAGVTSGRGVWRDDDMLPEGHVGVSGEYFYAPDGFLFGSPHFAMYRRDLLLPTLARWDVSFASAGPGIRADTKARLMETRRMYMLYDTGKLVNIFLQDDGARLCHFEHENLVHIGGMSHYLSPPDGPGGSPEDAEWPWPVTRLEVARFTATVLRALVAGQDPPPLPSEVDPALAPRLARVREQLIALVTTYRGRAA